MPRQSTFIILAALMGVFTGGGGALLAQNLAPENPVFVNDSPAAAEALLSVQENLGRGNVDQAIRLLQRLLDDQPLAAVQSKDDPALYLSVRTLVHELLLRDKELLARYRQLQGPFAADRLAEGDFAQVELQRFLTPSGLTAALRLAVEHIEAARFDAALLVLGQVDRHPDLSATGNLRAAGECAALLAAYKPAALALAERWRAAAGLPPAPQAVITPPLRLEPISSLSPAQRPDLTGLVAQPLASAPYGPVDPEAAGRASGLTGAAAEDLPLYGRELRSVPLLVGDTVFIASGKQIAAFDRFTLTVRWSRALDQLPGIESEPRNRDEDRPFPRRGGAAPPDDVRLLSASASMVLVAAAADPSGASDPREVIAAFEPATGKLLWSTLLSDLDGQIEGGHVRGPIMLDPGGSVAVAVVRKDRRERRFRAVYLVGVNTVDGTPAWSALVGSAGSLPFWQPGSLSEGAVLVDGVVYSVDRVGVASAHEAASGRPLWIRRLEGESYDNSVRSAAWQMNAPVIRSGRMLMLSPDRKHIVTLDAASGRRLASAETSKLRSPLAYLLAAPDQLVGVSESAIAFLAYDNLAGGAVSEVRIKEPGIRGRVVLAGQQLLVPERDGIAIVESGKPEPVATIPLDEMGNFVVSDSQVIVADDSRLHSYFSWTAADRLLSARIGEQPGDPAPGIALAELAYRAGRDDRIVPGIDAARAALDRPALDRPADASAGQEQRERLIASLRTMIDGAQLAAAPQGRGPLELALVGQLVERLGQVVRAPADRAAHLLVEGRHAENLGDPAAAARSYQRILDDLALGQALWQGARLGVAAETEATHRLEQLVGKHGGGVYEPFERAADDALATLPADAPIPEMERLARRFPVAVASARLWDRIAQAHESEKRSRSAARALEIGLQTAERIPAAPPAVVGELGGRLVTNLLDRGLIFAAEESLRHFRSTFGQVALTVGGQPLDEGALGQRIGGERAQNQRWPSVGLPVADGPQVLAQWALMEPLVREPTPAAPTYFVMRHQDGRVAVFSRAAANADGFSPVWTFQSEQHQAELLRQDRASAYFYTAVGRQGGSITRVDPVSGKQVWATEPLSSHFPEGAGVGPAPLTGPRALRQPVDRIATPLEGLRPASEVLFASDERTLALVDRSGRGVAFDADSGQRLWAASIALPGVYDCAVFRNILAVAGEGDRAAVLAAATGGIRPKASSIVLMDVRTGELLRTVALEPGPIRWIRFTPRGDLIVGVTGAVAAIDCEAGAVTWRNTQAPCISTQNAWVAGENVLIEAEGRTLWLLSASSGLLRSAPVDVRDRAGSSTAVSRASFTADGNLALSSPLGLAVIGIDGSVIGLDAVGRGENLLPPQPVVGGFATIETDAAIRERGVKTAFDLHLLDPKSAMLLRSARLELADAPSRMAAIDGRIAITAGGITVIYAAPVDGR